MKLFLTAFIAIFFLYPTQITLAQSKAPVIPDVLKKKFDYYNFKKQQDVLFAHFDKNVYTSNENAWFTAYLLNSTSNENDVLSIMLVNDYNGAIVAKNKFKMDKGVASGSVFLHDTIPPGNYSFMLYTNIMVNGEPKNVFTQQITIKGTSQSSYKANLLLQDDDKTAKVPTTKVLLMTQSVDANLLAGATVNYYVGDKEHPTMKGTAKTDNAGQYLFTIPTKNITAENNVLHTQVIYGKEIKTVNIALPVQKSGLVVRFYPEGGNLSDGIPSVVGWEVKNTQGSPFAAKGTLYKDGKQVDTISTNEFGLGRFTVVPNKESNYTVKLGLSESRDSVFSLPAVLANAPVVTIANSLVNDTLKLVIKNKQPGKFYALVHNYQQVFNSVPVQLTGGSTAISIPLTDLPRGIAEITLLDSLERPYAERLFFAHYDQRDVLKATTDNNEYKTRQKVNVKLNLTGPDGKPVKGSVSIACVQANRVDVTKATDIASYFYLNDKLGALPTKQDNWSDKGFLEDVLLIKGWRRYTWADLMQASPKDTLKRLESLRFKGDVTDLGKPVKKSISFTLTRDSSRITFITAPNGGFDLDNEDLFVTENEKVHLFVNSNDKVEYFFNITDPYVKVNELLASQYSPRDRDYVLSVTQKDNQESLKGFEHSIQLREVKIRGVDSLMNACGDYYCINGILNCPNHHHDPGNKVPEKGKIYYIFNPLTETKKPYKYTGCNPDEDDADKGFSGIHYGIEFYPADYEKDNTPETQYLSTIYWNRLYNITPDKEATVSFFTGDITGAFKIIVQGITDSDVVYGEKSFTVNK